ncbi:MAG TPA: phosphoglucosamine mutase, partial [Elusimicrobia bacterium]|nr:phosphoglucosamine mutase [Elusimicrobiota bacterium]
KILKDRKAKKEYLSHLKKTVPKNFSLKGKRIVVDCANGATCEFVSNLFARFGAGVIMLNAQPNGENINLQCGSLHLEQLCQTVKDTHSDLGFAFDGDGDRVLFSDELGNPVDGDQLMCLLAEEWKNKGKLKNNHLVVTRMSNFGLYELMQAQGIKIHTVSVGDRYVWEGMIKKKASLGGEQSGHIIFEDYSTTGDGLITALQILKIYQQEGLPFSKLFKMVKYPQVLLNLPVKMRKDLDTLSPVKEAIRQGEQELSHHGRIFVRYSGTEPLLRILVEGKDKNQIKKIAENIALIAKKELS